MTKNETTAWLLVLLFVVAIGGAMQVMLLGVALCSRAGAVSAPFRSLRGIWWRGEGGGAALGFMGHVVVGEGRRDNEIQVHERARMKDGRKTYTRGLAWVVGLKHTRWGENERWGKYIHERTSMRGGRNMYTRGLAQEVEEIRTRED